MIQSIDVLILEHASLAFRHRSAPYLVARRFVQSFCQRVDLLLIPNLFLLELTLPMTKEKNSSIAFGHRAVEPFPR